MGIRPSRPLFLLRSHGVERSREEEAGARAYAARIAIVRATLPRRERLGSSSPELTELLELTATGQVRLTAQVPRRDQINGAVHGPAAGLLRGPVLRPEGRYRPYLLWRCW